MKSPRKIPFLDSAQACAEIARLTPDLAHARDPRERIKQARRLAFAGTSIAMLPSHSDMALIETGLAALGLARRNGAVTEDLNRATALLAKARLELMGCVDALVRTEKKKMVETDSACLACSGDTRLDPDAWTGEKPAVLAAMNRGDFFIVATGADGRCGVTLRIVEAPEPVLTPNEYKRLSAATDVGLVRATRGFLYFGAAENLAGGAKVPCVDAMMKVQAFALGERVCLVACPAKDAPPPLVDIPQLC